MEKKCSQCGEIRSIEEFTKKSSSKDGHNAACKTCTRNTVKKHYEENKQYYLDKTKRRRGKEVKELKEWFVDYKKTLCCNECGEARWYLLDFHHRDLSEKEYNVSNLFTHGKKRLIKEIEKCIVLCSNCHRELHHFERMAV